MFVGHKIRTDEEMKALIRIGVRAREKRKKHKQNQVDAQWIGALPLLISGIAMVIYTEAF